MRILITGDKGVIGTELKKFLVGNELMCIDKVDGFNLAKNPLDAIVEFDPEVVFHLAASFERLYEDSRFFGVNQEDNILATTWFNSAISKCNSVKKYIFASSYLVYNDGYYTYHEPQIAFRIDEQHELKPRNLIGASKLYAEKEIEFIGKGKFDYVFARIFRVYGNGSKDVVSRSVRAKIEGIQVATYNLKNCYDFIHAKDVAEALWRLSGLPFCGVVNVGTGVTTSIEKVFKTIGCETYPINAKGLLSQPYENSVCNNETLWEVTGWSPSIMIEDGVKMVEEYERTR